MSWGCADLDEGGDDESHAGGTRDEAEGAEDAQDTQRLERSEGGEGLGEEHEERDEYDKEVELIPRRAKVRAPAARGWSVAGSLWVS